MAWEKGSGSFAYLMRASVQVASTVAFSFLRMVLLAGCVVILLLILEEASVQKKTPNMILGLAAVAVIFATSLDIRLPVRLMSIRTELTMKICEQIVYMLVVGILIARVVLMGLDMQRTKVIDKASGQEITGS